MAVQPRHTAPLPRHLLTTEQMYAADRAAVEAGRTGLELMENAGARCVDAIVERIEPGATLVLCGPGNNGGDGFVVARRLQALGWPVTVAMLGTRQGLSNDAAAMAARWHGAVCAIDEVWLDAFELVVDALFGAGLSRPLDGVAAEIVAKLNGHEVPVCAVDMPSGIDGNTGSVKGSAVEAAFTVTFFRKKPGHVLLPGRRHCGEVVVADIGVPESVLVKVAANIYENTPHLWRHLLPLPDAETHKYRRGHAVVVSGDEMHTGAARLGAYAALRAGAGLVTLASPPDASAINAVHLTAVMLREFEGAESLSKMLSDKRFTAVLIGPGAGVGADTRSNVKSILGSGAASVLDADALTSFKSVPERLFESIVGTKGRAVVMTPHDGEFHRLFSGKAYTGAKTETVANAAKASGATVILKGADTVIAAPDGRIAINAHASPWLATAGSGDVLAGIVTGLLAQGMAGFEAACAATWMHGDAAIRFGPGLIAEDLSPQIPSVIGGLIAGEWEDEFKSSCGSGDE